MGAVAIEPEWTTRRRIVQQTPTSQNRDMGHPVLRRYAKIWATADRATSITHISEARCGAPSSEEVR